VQALLEAQLAERQRVTDERLGGALVRHLLDELDDEAAVALDKFKE
jgi:predicted N-acetyltransferase YhbS